MKNLHVTAKPALVFYFLCSIFISVNSQAQELTFVKGFGGSSFEDVTDIEVDANGNIYMIGSFSGTVDFDPGAGVTELTATDGKAIFVTKFDPSGTLTWVKQIGSGSAAFGVSSSILKGKIELDNSGNIYICGHFAYSADFDPGAGVTTLTPAGSEGYSDIFFSKWDNNGNLDWVKQIKGSSNSNDLANDIAIAPNGNLFITGAFRGTVDFDPGAATNSLTSSSTMGYLAEYTSNGAYVWAGALFRAQTSNPVFQGSTVVVNSAGEPFVGGNIKVGQFSSLGFIINISTTYNLKRYWEYESFGSTNPRVSINSLALDENDNLYATGSFDGTLDDLVSAGNSDVLAISILSNGAQFWKKRMGGANFDQGVGISVGQSGEIYIIGEMGGAGDFDPGLGDLQLTGTSFISAVDENGDLFRSAKAIDVTGASFTDNKFYGGFHAIESANSKIYLGGTYRDGDDLDPSDETVSLSAAGNLDAFLSVFTPQPVTFTIDENLPQNANVGEIPASSAITQSSTIISGNIDDAFAIDFDKNRFYVNNPAALDYETNPDFRIEVSTPGEPETYVIILNDLDESPVIENQEFTIISTIASGDEIGSIVATDPNEDELTFSIVSGDPDDIFSLNASTGVLSLVKRDLLDFSAPDTIALEIAVSDGTETSVATISVILNAAPSFSFMETSFAFDEESAWTVSIALSDPESDALQVVIEQGNEEGLLKVISSSNDVLQVAPVNEQNGIDFETESTSFQLIFKAVDAAGNQTFSETIAVTINNINDNSPTLNDQEVTFSEGTPNGTTVVTLSGQDADGDTLTYSIVSGNTDDAFAIDSISGELKVNNTDALIFDINPTFTLTVSVSDGDFSTNATTTINLFQSTVPIIEDQTFVIIDTISAGEEVGQIEAFDAQGDDLTFTLNSGNENGIFSLDSASGILTVADRAALDFSVSDTINLTVVVSDGAEESSANISVTLNVAPQFTWDTTSFSFDENQRWFLEVPVSDPESDELTLSILSGDENNVLSLSNTAAVGGSPLFEIFPESADGIDYELQQKSFDLLIRASDAFGNVMQSDTIFISINNINDNVPQAQNQSLKINQNLPEGLIVAIVDASDADGDKSITYEISAGNTSGAFEIDSLSGEIAVSNSSALDFATNPVFTLEILISDGELSSNITITLNLNEQDVNTAPKIDNQKFSIEENSDNGTIAGTVVARDLEGDELTYRIVDETVSGAFILTSSTGDFLVNEAELLDFETTPSFEFLISVTDGEFTEVAQVIIDLIDIEDSNTSPSISDQEFLLPENSPAGTIVGTVIAMDEENDSLFFSIDSGNELGTFALDSLKGELTVSNQEQLDFETTPNFELLVNVTDGEFSASATIVIELTDEEEESLLGKQKLEANLIYPNPSADFFRVDLNVKVQLIIITDLSGKALQEYRSNFDGRYSVEGIKAGVYHVLIYSENQIFTEKLLIK